MTIIVISYRMLSVFNFYEPGMSWKELFMMFILTFLIGAILLAVSNILIKFYPSLLKKVSMLDIDYGEPYDENYVKQPHLLERLVQVKMWKVVACILVLIFVLIQYYTLIFQDI